MKDIFNKSLKTHLLAILSGLILVSVIGYGVFFSFSGLGSDESQLQTDLTAKYEKFGFKPYYPTFQNDYNEAFHALKYTLAQGGVALMGSSELTSYKSRFTTYNFMEDDLGINLRAFGHAGYQNKAILTELLSVFNQQVAENGRVVILLSPSWFATGDRMHEGLWKGEVASPIITSRIKENVFITDEYKKEVVSLSENVGPVAKLDTLLRRYYDIQFLKVNKLNHDKPASNVQPDWEAWTRESLDFEEKLSSNEYGINDDYFNEHVKPLLGTSKFPFKLSTGVPIEENKEIEDLKTLLKFLEGFKNKPLFVILPLNPKAYSNLDVLDDEIRVVEKLLNEYNYPVLNFWFTQNPQGVLTDTMHTGAYGWVLVNEFIYKHQTGK